MQHYSKDPVLSEARSADWVKVSDLDAMRVNMLRPPLVPLGLIRVFQCL